MDGLMLGFIARELSSKLTGARVDRVLQPERDELHLVLRGQAGTYRLLLCASANNARVHLTAQAKPNPEQPPMFCMLLRKLIGNGRIRRIEQVGGDRVLEIALDTLDELGEPVERILSCEMMGRHSNIILRDEDGRISDAIRHVGADVSRVREAKPGIAYTPPPPQDKLNPATATVQELRTALEAAPARLDKALGAVLMGVGMQSAQELATRLTAQESPHLDARERAALAEPLHALLSALPSFGPPVLVLSEEGEALDVCPFPQKRLSPQRQKEFPQGPSAAMDAYYLSRDRRERLAQKAVSLQRTIKTHIERTEKKLALHEEILTDEARLEEAKIQGELLTANLHLVEKAQMTVEVPDYYTGTTRVIELDPRLSPAHNAQRYYKQYQKMRAAQRHAVEQVEQARAELDFLESELDDLRKATEAAELDEIRQELVRRGYLRATHSRNKPRKQPHTRPLAVTSSDGVVILVGKNGAQNDRITAEATPDALWMHAKGMAGSHVIIEYPGEVPDKTFYEAAQLAAYYSRGYRSAQVPIDYTQRRYVKKPAGAPPGFMTYTHQNTLYVTPDEAAVKRLLEAQHD